MRKNLFTAFFAFCLMTGNVMADNMTLKVKTPAADNELPIVVKQFLATPVGRTYNAEQVMQVYKDMNRTPVRANESTNIVSTVVLDEDFSKWTQGSEEAPDTADVADKLDSLNNMKDWTGFLTYQAGGKAYFGYDDNGSGPGYLMTPAIDLTEGDGIYKVTFRVKNVNPDVTDQGLQYFVMNNDPNNKNMYIASTLPMSTEWKDVELLTDGGLKYTSVMFFGWQGKVLVDNVKIEKLAYPLSKATDIKATVAGGGKIAVDWAAVEGATSYTVELYDSNDNKTVATTTSDTNSAIVEGAFNPAHKFYVYVTAENGTDKSYPAHIYTDFSVESVDAPVATDATDVSTSGFTANWEASANAANYKLTLVRTHTATEDGEEVTYMDEDFSEIPYSNDDPSSTIMTKDYITPASFDAVINTPGWSTMLGVAFTGCLAITNMYEAYGMPGVLLGPISDYSIGEGKATISGTGFTSNDDVQVEVGFGKYTLGTVTFNEGAQTFELSPTGNDFNVTVSGGSANSRLIFKIVDAAEGGDMAAFSSLKIGTTLKKGDASTLTYGTATLPYNETSYRVDVPFTGQDKFEYYVSGSFGSVASKNSNTITVLSPEYDGISTLESDANATEVYTTLDGVRVDTPTAHGVYVVKKGNSTFKVMK